MATYTVAPQGKLADVRGSVALEGADASGYSLKALLPRTQVICVDLVRPNTSTVLSQNEIIAITVPWACRVLDVWNVCGATATSCTTQVRNSTNAIHTAIACAVAKAIVRVSAGMDPTYWKVAKGVALQVLIAGANTGANSRVYILVEVLP